MNKEDLAHLPAPKRAPPPPRQHSWNVVPVARVHGIEFPDGNGRTLRTCSHCGMVKVTVHAAGGSRAWREWRTKDGQVWHGELTPPCLEILEGQS